MAKQHKFSFNDNARRTPEALGTAPAFIAACALRALHVVRAALAAAAVLGFVVGRQVGLGFTSIG